MPNRIEAKLKYMSNNRYLCRFSLSQLSSQLISRLNIAWSNGWAGKNNEGKKKYFRLNTRLKEKHEKLKIRERDNFLMIKNYLNTLFKSV